MPTYKHPCPHCGNFIERDVKRCPFCATIDPFVPGRCPTCRAPLEDPRWVACPKCGSALRDGVAAMPPPFVPGAPGAAPGMPGASTVAPGAAPGAIPGWGPPMPAPVAAAAPSFPAPVFPAPVAPVPAAPAPVVPAPPVPPVVNTAAFACTGCGAALAPGARFCTVCGTLAG